MSCGPACIQTTNTQQVLYIDSRKIDGSTPATHQMEDLEIVPWYSLLGTWHRQAGTAHTRQAVPGFWQKNKQIPPPHVLVD
ncbi:uncharacterized protein PGTG_00701 [Puccinia graminis f. sp. tritici CRL 75-36-700-3]|uniref:Uncharacterized protein n=1 Tax=Puccinia graminis f. sp. tritici (strain CRL 75-36-700-3 / race SCCL) TaxID=418459 RepID=E3JRF0_PUCGT|nr:uncharacterized protein PGTG_00701 [Puccinia graminis f. sp. tritici CRL 75-36-700-3]EFP74745.1 hypothetical protein PGTG_00701 [Puccinia graminis f. sp. tritici CRL 75-36-700-3]